MDNIYLTQEGYDKLFKELEHLKKVKRKEISKRIGEARAMGDLSENAEYDAAKEAQAHLEKKIMELENKLAHAQIMDKKDINLDKVALGTKVSLRDLETQEEFYYVILSDEEADFDKNQIGVNSPVARALLGKKKGDSVEAKAPRKTFHYKILDITLP